MTKKLAVAVISFAVVSFAVSLLAPRITAKAVSGPGAAGSPASASSPARSTLNIYFIDVEGGAATLIVTPAGESILVDAGWPGFGDRDAKRIQRAMQMAGVTEIDHMIATHYHVDHYGGIPGLAKAVPIKHFYDHGKISSLPDDQDFTAHYSAYQGVTGGKSTTLKPGDTIALKPAPGAPAVKILFVSGNGQVINGSAHPGPASPNSACAGAKLADPDPTDNARSLGFVLSFGGFRFLDLGDLTWNIEQKLVCPVDRLGHIDLYQVTHHGFDISNNPVLLRTIQPTVAVMDNGPRKGGNADTVARLRAVGSIKALYQLHRNVESSADQNSAPELIANPDEKPDAGYMITVSVDAAKRAFTLTNERTDASNGYGFKQSSR